MKHNDVITLVLSHMPSPIGGLWLVADHEGKAVGISMRAGAKAVKARLQQRYPKAEFGNDTGVLDPLQRWLSLYFSGNPPAPQTVGWRLDGTVFQRRVWEQLAMLPYGDLITYGELAARVGCGSARAVGQAVGRNPLPILIPCHRVVAANRGLGGFSSGIPNKIKLLNHEGLSVDRVNKRIKL